MSKNLWDKSVTIKKIISDIGQNTSVLQLFHGKWSKIWTISHNRDSGI